MEATKGTSWFVFRNEENFLLKLEFLWGIWANPRYWGLTELHILKPHLLRKNLNSTIQWQYSGVYSINSNTSAISEILLISKNKPWFLERQSQMFAKTNFDFRKNLNAS